MSTILIVEDDVNINEMLKVALQKEGYSCIQAFSGTEGRLVLSQEEPDLVLLDLMLPGMSGETLLEEIRQTKRAGKSPGSASETHRTGREKGSGT